MCWPKRCDEYISDNLVTTYLEIFDEISKNISKNMNMNYIETYKKTG